jgi:hypothetical protein
MTHEGREIAAVAGAVVASLVLTLGVLAVANAPPPSQERAGSPLAAGDSTARCEACHPRQTAEWRRSVMAHAARSPLFQALELLIEEQVGRSNECPRGAGVLRRREDRSACRDAAHGIVLTGSGGEGWCVNCHAPGQNLAGTSPSFSAALPAADNRPLGELLNRAGEDGIGCTFCHQVGTPAHAGTGVNAAGNPTWSSPLTGRVFDARPAEHDRRFGISNSGYRLEPAVLLAASGTPLVPGGAHRRLEPELRDYVASSEFCGTCHDVRLFGTDVLGRARGEHFKRLRNAYSEWLEDAARRREQGLEVPSCQGCHMSSYPGVCVAGGPDAAATAALGAPPRLAGGCPPNTHFEPRAPGTLSFGFASTALGTERPLHAHDFAGVEVPLTPDFDQSLADERVLEENGRPLGVRARRDLLLRASVRLALGVPRRAGGRWQIPVTVENVGAGHRVPAGFSQERELWLELSVSDEHGRVLYEVGRVERADEDLADKRFLRVTTRADGFDELGRPLGLFGADVADGPDAPRWDPPPELGGTRFRGQGLVSFQNGFLRCVRCIGRLDEAGRCQPLPGQEGSRAERFADGDYDLDTGTCGSNLAGRAALFETYFPVGALDASRGILKAPDAIIDTRSLPPATPVSYVYDLGLAAARVHVTARLLFRAFPPYLIRAFAAYEAAMSERGERPHGPLVTADALERLEIVELARAETDGG